MGSKASQSDTPRNTVPWMQETSDGVILTIKVAPRSNASEIAGVESEWVKVRLKAPPVDGKANEALIKLFADVFSVPRGAVSLLTGSTGRLKRVKVSGVSATAVRAVIH